MARDCQICPDVNSGNTLGIFWECSENTLGTPWEYFANTLGTLCRYSGNTVGILWECSENPLVIISNSQPIFCKGFPSENNNCEP